MDRLEIERRPVRFGVPSLCPHALVKEGPGVPPWALHIEHNDGLMHNIGVCIIYGVVVSYGRGLHIDIS